MTADVSAGEVIELLYPEAEQSRGRDAYAILYRCADEDASPTWYLINHVSDLIDAMSSYFPYDATLGFPDIGATGPLDEYEIPSEADEGRYLLCIGLGAGDCHTLTVS